MQREGLWVRGAVGVTSAEVSRPHPPTPNYRDHIQLGSLINQGTEPTLFMEPFSTRPLHLMTLPAPRCQGRTPRPRRPWAAPSTRATWSRDGPSDYEPQRNRGKNERGERQREKRRERERDVSTYMRAETPTPPPSMTPSKSATCVIAAGDSEEGETTEGEKAGR